MLKSGILEWVNQYLGTVSQELLYPYFFAESPMLENDANGFSIRNPDKGIELVLSRLKVIENIHLFGEENKTHKAFKEKLPLNLSFSLSRREIADLFGKPKKKGGGNTNVLLGFKNTWDKFYFQTHTLRIEYSKPEDRIVLITLGSLPPEGGPDH